ncbi:MAG: sugar phosphate isomerase/epimerase [Phycisphaeraceae bacterium]|nr:sugar phosphate isomerase/epimerase [Phycisphaeraceae bacterium]
MVWALSAFADEAGPEVDQQIAALLEAGIGRVDLRNVGQHNISALPLDLAQQTARKLGQAKIKVGMFGSPIGKIDIADPFEIDMQKLEHLGKLKDVFGCSAVRIFSYYNKAGRAADAWAQESLSRLKKLRDRAAQLGLVLYHENERHIFGDRLAENLRIAQEVRDGKSFLTIFDFDNYNQSGDDVWHNWEVLRDKVDAIHLKDSDAQKQHVPVGQGTGQVKKILADAVKRQWQGPMSLEPHLVHSSAVMATGVGGQANEQLKNLPPEKVFQVAARAAKQIIAEVGGPVG